MKAVLLRVGIDSSYGALSPVWSDLSYEYIPIPVLNKKEQEKKERRTFKNLGLGKYLPVKFHNAIAHLDPEFKSFTYGDPNHPKRNILSKLKKGDLLVFYLGGRELDSNEIGCFIFGYFVVEYVFNWDKLNDIERKEASKICKENAHIRSSKSRDNLIIVKGSSKSKKLKYCIPISMPNNTSNNPPYFASVGIQNLIGIRKSIVRAVPILIEEKNYLSNLKMLLGISKLDINKIDGKIPFSIFARIVKEDKKLNKAEKLFLLNFMMSKTNNYRNDAENFGSDMYLAEFKNTEILDEYFMQFYDKV